jgi:tRNA nucleotidyltransferase (CCA-adding enzyme)
VWIVKTLEEAGFETWAVGGAVRDALFGEPGGDWDLATRARPEEIQSAFRRTVPIGIEHGTVGVLARDGTLYEVTTFRKDVATDGRRAVVEFAEQLEDDLARRDFTINAVAWHPTRHEWRDPFGGREDLEKRCLRTVGDPRARFAEDLLRVLRALRFAGRFDLSIESGTWEALRASVGEVHVLSAERVREELAKVLNARVPSAALRLYAESALLAELYPELCEDGAARPEFDRTLLAIDRVSRNAPMSRWALLLATTADGSPGTTEAIMKRLRCSNAETAAVSAIVRALHLEEPEGAGADARRWLARVGDATWPGVARIWAARARLEVDEWPGPGLCEARSRVAARIRRLRAVVRSGVPLTTGDLALDGNDLKEMGLVPGPEFGEILDALLDRVLADPEVNEPEGLRQLVWEVLAREGE